MKQILDSRKQVLVIHGGNAYSPDEHQKYLDDLAASNVYLEYKDYQRSRKWKETLGHNLGRGWIVCNPTMPSRDNAKYDAWKVWFENHLEILNPGALLIGHSLGGIFLAKYIAENGLPEELEIRGVILVAATHHGENPNATLYSFELPNDMSKLAALGPKVTLMHSKDDEVVWWADFEAYKQDLPDATFMEFDSYGHFSVKEFPEIVEVIKNYFAHEPSSS